jgi:hypothetical protein
MAQAKINKQIFIVIMLLVLTQFSFGQKTEINFNAYSGLFSFRGDGSSSTSWINFNPYTSPYKYTSNPYGKKSEFSYALELQGQRVTKNKNIYGLGISFETLTSKVNIDTVTQNGFFYWQYSASGKTTLKNTFITLNPFVGHRYSYRKITFDLLAGFDLAFCLKSKEVGNATTNNKDYVTVENIKTKPLIDFRPRIQINTQINKFGLLAGYSFGLTNYQSQNNLKAFTSFLRLGLSYRLK